jgi:hypothetical protein
MARQKRGVGLIRQCPAVAAVRNWASSGVCFALEVVARASAVMLRHFRHHADQERVAGGVIGQPVAPGRR